MKPKIVLSHHFFFLSAHQLLHRLTLLGLSNSNLKLLSVNPSHQDAEVCTANLEIQPWWWPTLVSTWYPTIELLHFLKLKVYTWIQSQKVCYKKINVLPKPSTQTFRNARDKFASTMWFLVPMHVCKTYFLLQAQNSVFSFHVIPFSASAQENVS